MEDRHMAKQTRAVVNRRSDADRTEREIPSLEQREAMIRAAAYYHYAKRDYTSGHNLDDWLAAKVELKRWIPSSQEFPLALFLRAAIEIFPHSLLAGGIAGSKEEPVLKTNLTSKGEAV